MASVSKEALDRLNYFFEALPKEVRNKCALCNETLTHIVKTAEVETGAGTATVTRELAKRINEGAAPGDQVSGGALRHRVQRAEGAICSNRANKLEPKNKQENQTETDDKHEIKEIKRAKDGTMRGGARKGAGRKPKQKLKPPKNHEEDNLENLKNWSESLRWAETAIAHLENIKQNDPNKTKALDMVIEWAIKRKEQFDA
jgi:ribosomal protein L44E